MNTVSHREFRQPDGVGLWATGGGLPPGGFGVKLRDRPPPPQPVLSIAKAITNKITAVTLSDDRNIYNLQDLLVGVTG